MDNFYRRMKPLLGTFVEIGINQMPNGDQIVDKAFDQIKQVQVNLSFHDPSSELSSLNNSCGQKTKLSKLSIRILRLAKAMTQLSDHKFNCTVGNSFKVVDQTTLKLNDQAVVGSFSDMTLDKDTAQLSAGIKVTLDGIAKGYAVDLAIKVLKQSGASLGWVNAGGDIKVFGDRRWPIQIRANDGRAMQLVYLENMALATSSYKEIENPDYPARIVSTSAEMTSNFGTWSVISKSAWRADALTKVAANSNDFERESILKKLGGFLVHTTGE